MLKNISKCRENGTDRLRNGNLPRRRELDIKCLTRRAKMNSELPVFCVPVTFKLLNFNFVLNIEIHSTYNEITKLQSPGLIIGILRCNTFITHHTSQRGRFSL